MTVAVAAVAIRVFRRVSSGDETEDAFAISWSSTSANLARMYSTIAVTEGDAIGARGAMDRLP